MDAAAVLQPGTQISLRGERWTILASTHHFDCTSLRVAGSGRTNGGAIKTFLLPFDRIRPAAAASHPKLVGRRRWIHEFRRILSSCHPFGGLDVAATASLDLLPFQLEPALAMLRHGKLRLLIADEVGLGKTIQAGMILAQLASDHTDTRALVITPAGLRAQWRDELRCRFTLETTLADAAWLADTARCLPSHINPWSLPGIFVTSIDLVKRPEVLRSIEEVVWDAVVIDEAHGLGAATARLAAADALARRSRRVVLMTATPPYGDPAQMEALTSVGRLHEQEPVTIFRRTRREAGLSLTRRSVLLPVRISAVERRLHRALDAYAAAVWRECERRGDPRGRLATIVLRKRALSAPQSLALSLRRRLTLLSATAGELAEESQRALPWDDEGSLPDSVPDSVIGARGLENRTHECDWLQRLVALSEGASKADSKLRCLRRLLRRLREPVIVFTEYRDTLAYLAAQLAEHVPQVLHGGMSVAERDEVRRAFADSGTLLLATDAASEGLNLHHRCRVIVQFELPWTPMRLEQRCGRVDRLGQQSRVHEILLVARHTAERLVLAPLFTRIRNAAAAGDFAAGALSEIRIAEMLTKPRGEIAAPTPTAIWTSTRLLTEAQAEAVRLDELRRLALPSRVSSHPSTTPLLWSRQSPNRATLLVRSSLETTDGWVLATDLLAVCVNFELRREISDRAGAAALASELVHQHRELIWTAVERQLQPSPRADSARADAVHHALAAREQQMHIGLPSAATHLVQAGLFDRRTVIESERRRRVSTELGHEAEHRLTEYAKRLCRTRLGIVGILLGNGPPR